MTRFGNPTPREKPTPSRKADKSEKKWSVKPWDAGSPTDDGIVAWMKRQTLMEAKRGKKRPLIVDAEHYFPVSKNCSEISDLDLFKTQSLHDRFLPKSKKSKKNKETGNGPASKYTNNSNLELNETDRQDTPGPRIPPVDGNENVDEVSAFNKEVKSLEAEPSKTVIRSAGVLEHHSKQQELDKNGSRANVYHKIKRILKFSKFGENKPHYSNAEEDEDEGYASKTSSAELKDDKDTNVVDSPRVHGMYSSMVDLSALSPRDPMGPQRFKFSYTHQVNPRLPPESDFTRMEREKTIQLAVRLQQVPEPLQCPHLNSFNSPQEETTIYGLDSDTLKPVTLVLRKISIQDADKSIPEQVTSMPIPSRISDRPRSQASSRPGSTRNNSRVGSAEKRQRLTYSRPTSYKSRSNTSSPDKHNSKTEKEPHWSPKLSQAAYYDRQSNTYSIGDLLPAVDKSIYSKQTGKTNNTQDVAADSPIQKVDAATEYSDPTKTPTSQAEDYAMLRKGMEAIAGAIEKPTLGPPPFRPNQTRHPLIRDASMVVDNRTAVTNPYQYQLRSSPTLGTNRRINSDKGPRPKEQTIPDKETRKKLREAFTRFYNQRPKDIGREFRRVQTMWNA